MTSKVLKYFLTTIISLSLLSGLPFFTHLLNINYLAGLSLWGIKHFLFWQVLTYMFFYPAFEGIHAGFLIQLFFNMYILWKIGLAITYAKGLRHFLFLFLGSGLIVGLVALCTLYLTLSPQLYAGTTPALFSLLVATIILYPDMDVMLFLTIPVKAKYLIGVVLGAVLLIDLSNGQILNFATNFTGSLFGYFYAITAWKCRSPFLMLQKFETFLLKFPSLFSFHKRTNLDSYDVSGAKIYDFKTGQKIFDDESFLDACLSKISQEGKNSLSLMEKFRLWRISRKRAKNASKRKHNYQTYRDR